MKEMDKSVQKLGELSSRLDELSSRHAKFAREIEEKIAATDVRVEVWLEQPLQEQIIGMGRATYEVRSDGRLSELEMQDANSSEVVRLGWARIGSSGWGLAAKTEIRTTGYVDEFERDMTSTRVVDLQPLSNSPRMIRLLAVPRLQELVDKLCDEVARHVEAGEQAESSAEEGA